MPRCLTVAVHLPIDELERRYRRCRDSIERTHWHMVWLVALGRTCPAVAELLGYTEDWVRTVIHRYNDQGPAGLVDRRHTNPGQRPLVPPAVREELREILAEPPPDGGVWTGRKVAAWMAARLGRPVGEVRGWEAMRALGFTPQRPRPRATTADPAAQDVFRKQRSWLSSGRRWFPPRCPVLEDGVEDRQQLVHAGC